MKCYLPILLLSAAALAVGPAAQAQDCESCGGGTVTTYTDAGGYASHEGAPCTDGACPRCGRAGHGHHLGNQTLMGAIAARNAQRTSWHGSYYDPAWGMPVAIVVPPTAQSQTNWGWGVGNTRVTGIPHQFQPGYPMGGGMYDRGMFRPTPPWPSDTTQFGYYYVRGPW